MCAMSWGYYSSFTGGSSEAQGAEVTCPDSPRGHSWSWVFSLTFYLLSTALSARLLPPMWRQGCKSFSQTVLPSELPPRRVMWKIHQALTLLRSWGASSAKERGLPSPLKGQPPGSEMKPGFPATQRGRQGLVGRTWSSGFWMGREGG